MRIQRRNLASFAEAFGLWYRSLLAARMFTKWSNFAKPKQTRAKPKFPKARSATADFEWETEPEGRRYWLQADIQQLERALL